MGHLTVGPVELEHKEKVMHGFLFSLCNIGKNDTSEEKAI